MIVLPNLVERPVIRSAPAAPPGPARVYRMSSLSDFTYPDGEAAEEGASVIERIVEKEFGLQKQAVMRGLIKPGTELPPKYTLEILDDPTDPDFEGYSVIALAVPSGRSERVIGMVRPGVGRLKDGTPYVRMFFGPIVDETFEKGTANGRPIETYLMDAAFNRVEAITRENPAALVDNQCGVSATHLRSYGFGRLISRVGVPNVDAEGPGLYHADNRITLLARSGDGTQSLPLSVAQQMARGHMEKCYGVPSTARLIRHVEERLERMAGPDGRVALS